MPLTRKALKRRNVSQSFNGSHPYYSFQKTCHRSNVCPYDFSFWLDGSDNSCNDATFDTLQREKSELLMSFFTAYVRDDKAKMATAFWAENALTHSIGNYHTENTSVQFLKDQIQERIRLCFQSTC